MNQLLQLFGGVFYLLNKIFFSAKEHAINRNDKIATRKWKITAWIVYLIGLPAWVIILFGKHDWISLVRFNASQLWLVDAYPELSLVVLPTSSFSSFHHRRVLDDFKKKEGGLTTSPRKNLV